jgi:hypothetical protein
VIGEPEFSGPRITSVSIVRLPGFSLDAGFAGPWVGGREGDKLYFSRVVAGRDSARLAKPARAGWAHEGRMHRQLIPLLAYDVPAKPWHLMDRVVQIDPLRLGKSSKR